MAYLSAQQIAVTGTAPTYAAASAGGDTASPDDRTFLHVKNGSAGALTVTLVIPGTSYAQANPDVAVSVPAAGDRFIAIPSGATDLSTGLVGFSYSGVTSLTIALVRI